MEEINNKLSKKILIRSNILILLLLGFIIFFYAVQEKIFYEINQRQNFSSIDYSKPYEELNKNLASLEKKLEEKHNPDNDYSTFKDTSSNLTASTVNLDNIYLYTRLISTVHAAREILYTGDSFIEPLLQFENIIKDEKVRNIVHDMKKYVDRNISILKILEILDKINHKAEASEEVSQNLNFSNNIIHYISNIIKIKQISNNGPNDDLIKNIRRHIINRDIELALTEVENLNSLDSNVGNFKEKLTSISHINSLFNQLLTYLSSENFIKSNFYIHTPN